MNWKKTLLVIPACIALAGCSLPTSSSPTAAPTALQPLPTLALTVIPVQNATALPTVTGAPMISGPTAITAVVPTTTAAADTTVSPTIPTAPLPAPTQAATSSSFTPFKATTVADAVKLRMGPGTLFPALALLPKDTELTVLGISQGNEWIYVKPPTGAQGWVFVQLVQTSGDLKSAPGVEPDGVQIVKGKVTDKSGGPVDGLQFAFEQGAARTDAVTGKDGIFYAFFPATAKGQWTVSYVAISATSRMVNSAGNPQPETEQITLPQGQMLQFVWQ